MFFDKNDLDLGQFISSLANKSRAANIENHARYEKEVLENKCFCRK